MTRAAPTTQPAFSRLVSRIASTGTIPDEGGRQHGEQQEAQIGTEHVLGVDRGHDEHVEDILVNAGVSSQNTIMLASAMVATTIAAAALAMRMMKTRSGRPAAGETAIG